MPWHLLNYVPDPGTRRSNLPALIERFNATLPSPLELFAPTYVAVTTERGTVKKTEKPLLYHYIFLRGSEEDIKRLMQAHAGFSFVMDRTSSSRHLTVPAHTVDQFRLIARYYGNKLPCFPLGEVTLEEGDKVQIVSGPCAGLTGTFIPRKGGKKGNILVAVTSTLAAVVYDVRADYVRVLEFARDSRRAYDQIDAFIPHLLPLLLENSPLPSLSSASVTSAQRHFSAASLPSPPLRGGAAPLTIFTRRLGDVKLHNPKLDAKLQILLYAAYTLLGDVAAADRALLRYRALSPQVTNPWTRALALLILGTLTPDPALLSEARALIAGSPGPTSPLRTLLLQSLNN